MRVWRHSCWQESQPSQPDLLYGNRWRAAEVQQYTGVSVHVLLVLFWGHVQVFSTTHPHVQADTNTHTHTGWCRHTVCVWYRRHHTKSFPVLLHICDLNTVTNCWHSSSYNQPCIHCPAACIQTHTKEVSPFIWYFSLLPTQVTF